MRSPVSGAGKAIMKRPKKPTYRQKIIMTRRNMDYKEWLVEFEVGDKLGLIKKDGSARKVINL